jgi:hypothetical protein
VGYYVTDEIHFNLTPPSLVLLFLGTSCTYHLKFVVSYLWTCSHWTYFLKFPSNKCSNLQSGAVTDPIENSFGKIQTRFQPYYNTIQISNEHGNNASFRFGWIFSLMKFDDKLGLLHAVCVPWDVHVAPGELFWSCLLIKAVGEGHKLAWWGFQHFYVLIHAKATYLYVKQN